MQEVSFVNGGHRLDGTIFYPPAGEGKHPAILFVHGWTSERARSFQYAEALADTGYVCFLFDMRGHGTSEGDRDNSTNKDFLSDAVAAYDYLSKLENVNPEDISAVGSSLGGYLAALLPEKRRIKNLALRVPADYPNETFGDELKKNVGGGNPDVMNWRNRAKGSDETHALKTLHDFNGNVLILEAEKDDRVPHQTIMNYVNAVEDKSKLTYVLMKGHPHSAKEGKFMDEIQRILVDWFKNREH